MATEGGGVAGFRFRRLTKPEEFRAAEELQGLGPSGTPEPMAPITLLRAAQDHGGLVLGAFADIYLAGVSVGFLGFDGGALYHYLHRFHVRPEYQNHGLGFRLAAAVRGEVRQQGLESIRGTLDPLDSRAAFLAFHRLGARSDRYLVHYYGQLGAPEAPDRESDRILFRWAVADPRVESLVQGPPSAKDRIDPRFDGAPALLETETGESGLRLPSVVSEPTAPSVRIEIPFDVELIRQHEPEGARRWRHAVRDAFRAAFDLGYIVEDFELRSTDHERRGSYLLTAPPGPTPG